MSLLALPILVPVPIKFINCSSHSHSLRNGPGRHGSSSQKLPTSGVEYWFNSCRAHGLSRGFAVCRLKGNVVRETLINYQRCWRRFSTWFNRWEDNYSHVTVKAIIDFLLFLFNSKTSSGTDYSGEALNTFRSALAFFLKLDFPNLAYETEISLLFQSFYKLRPSFPRYVVTWDVGKVLRFLATWHPPSALTLKQLTLKTVALIALTSSDRAQTIHALRVDRVSITNQGLEFVIFDRLKTSRSGHPAKVVKCVSWDAQELDVAFYVQMYMNKTLNLRWRSYRRGLGKPVQLFLSHKTGLPVTKSTISRWIKEVMRMAGIDTNTFLPGSTRGASVSAAARRGASITNILIAGDWTNLGTYQRFYGRTLDDTPVGRLILEEANVS